MNRTWALRIILGGLVTLIVALLVLRTEWIDEDEDTPMRGAAVTDPHYAVAALVRNAGATFERHRNLETLPPRGATLLLEASQWDLFPERQAQLRHWVEDGGQLVIDASAVGNDALRAWVPVRLDDPARIAARLAARRAKGFGASAPRQDSEQAAPPTDDESSDADDGDDDASPGGPGPANGKDTGKDGGTSDDARPASGPRGAAARAAARTEIRCHDFREPAGIAPALPWKDHYQLCVRDTWHAVWAAPRTSPRWALSDGHHDIALRVAVGAGTVTAHNFSGLMQNDRLARADHAAAVASALQLHPSQVIWVVDDESQPLLAVWLWGQARPAILLAAAALVLWLWRRAVRFGPRVAEAELARRSIGEQVAGIAGFLRKHEPAALQRASRRALEELARRSITDYDTLDEAERVRAIADRSGIDAAALIGAMRPGPLSTPAQWIAASALLEQTRRALRQALRTPRA
jgi:hypothetical protein